MILLTGEFQERWNNKREHAFDWSTVLLTRREGIVRERTRLIGHTIVNTDIIK